MTTGAGTLNFFISSDGTLDSIELVLETILNPETFPATLEIELFIIPGIGVVDVDILLEIVRSGLAFSSAIDFDQGLAGTAEFDEISFGLEVTGGLIDLSTEAFFDLDGFQFGEVTLTVNF